MIIKIEISGTLVGGSRFPLKTFRSAVETKMLHELLPSDQAEFIFKLNLNTEVLTKDAAELIVEVFGVPVASEIIANAIGMAASEAACTHGNHISHAVKCIVSAANGDQVQRYVIFAPSPQRKRRRRTMP